MLVAYGNENAAERSAAFGLLFKAMPITKSKNGLQKLVERGEICLTVEQVADAVTGIRHDEQSLVFGCAVLVIFHAHAAGNKAIVAAVDE